MKLGEALTLRARQAQKLNDLQGRIKSSAMVQEGDTPAEDCQVLMTEYVEVSQAHATLNEQIARTNNTTVVDGASQTLAALIQTREALIRHRNLIRLACAAASPGAQQYRYMRSEVKLVPQIDVASLRDEEKKLEEMVNQLDTRIQRVNWATDLSS